MWVEEHLPPISVTLFAVRHDEPGSRSGRLIGRRVPTRAIVDRHISEEHADVTIRPENESPGFESFETRLRAGDGEAVRQLFDDYSSKLVQLAGKNIHPALLKRFDGEDVVQSVFRTFFRRHEEGDFCIEHSQQLWQLLVTLTLCKTRSHARRHTAEKRDAQVDQAMADDQPVLDRQPSPEDALALWEEVDVVLEGLPERTAEIIAMRLEGKNRSEIARELDLSRQTIHRILSLVQQRLERRFEEFSSPEPINSEKIEDSG